MFAQYFFALLVCLVIYCSTVMADDLCHAPLVPRAEGCAKAHWRRSVHRASGLDPQEGESSTMGEGLTLLFHRCHGGANLRWVTG